MGNLGSKTADPSAQISDPMERLIAIALERAGIGYLHGPSNPSGLDFHLPNPGVDIEVKQMHSPRIAEQMSRVENVIAVQGSRAVHTLGGLIERAGPSLEPGSDRRAVFIAIQTLVAGLSIRPVLEALCDSLAVGIAQASQTPEAADGVARALTDDIVRLIQENWAYSREVRAGMHSHPGGRA